MDELRKQIWGYAWIALAVLAVSLAVSILLAHRLQRFITLPILRLVEAMKRVTRKDDYSIRVEHLGDGELRVLNDGFNAMLDQIGQARRPCARPATNWKSELPLVPASCWWPRTQPRWQAGPRATFWPT